MTALRGARFISSGAAVCHFPCKTHKKSLFAVVHSAEGIGKWMQLVEMFAVPSSPCRLALG
jgi:hypothetical protein